MNDTFTGSDDGDNAMIEALKALDRPRRPEPEMLGRIESAMLGRFDDVLADDSDTEVSAVAGQLFDGGRPDEPQIVELGAARPEVAERSRRWQPVLAAAAVVAVAIAGWQIARAGDGNEVAVPAEQRDELPALYCTEFLEPLVAGLQLWSPNGSDSEARQDVQLLAEQAIQGYLDAGAVLGAENQARWMSMLEQAATSRLLARGRDQQAADDALVAVVNRIASNIDNTDWSPESASCSGDPIRNEAADE